MFLAGHFGIIRRELFHSRREIRIALQNLFKNNRNIFDAGLKRKVTPYEWGKEVARGLLAVETAGHTPGHTSYVLSSGSGKVFIQSDVTNNPTPFATNPGWHASFDQDGDVAEKTRRRVYDMVAAEKLQLQGFHYPFPGLAHVEKDGRLPRDPHTLESDDLILFCHSGARASLPL